MFLYIFALHYLNFFSDDDRDGEDVDKTNKCNLVWEVRKLSFNHTVCEKKMLIKL